MKLGNKIEIRIINYDKNIKKRRNGNKGVTKDNRVIN